MQKKNSNAYEKKEDTRFAVTEPAELMAFLLAKFPSKNRNNIKSLLRDKQVLVNDKITFQFNHFLQVNDTVRIRWTKAPAEKQYEGIKIVFEDEHLIVIEKEEGILSMATEKEKRKTAYSTLSEHVKKQNPKSKIFIIHRLDRETSGLMMFAKSEVVQKKMQESWQSTTKERVYLAIISGSPRKTEDTITSYLVESEKSMMVYSTQNAERGQKAVTHYETVQQNRYFSMLKVSLETGRKNQVRVHLQSMGHPIVGDKKYGSTTNPINRLALHAWVLSFQHPITQEQMHFETAIPTKFASLMNR